MFDVVIIGAGVIGLSIASLCLTALIIEKEESYGRETSSRNSVIHSGIYSLKLKHCLDGLYNYQQ